MKKMFNAYLSTQLLVRLLCLVLIILFSQCMIGCGTRSYLAQDEYKVSKNGYGRYGNFCGPGYPDSGTTDPLEDLKFLADREPYDLLDKTCKLHDMCYDEYPQDHAYCDRELVVNLLMMHDRISTRECEMIWTSVFNFAKENDQTALKIIGSPFTLTSELASALAESITHLSGKKIKCGEIDSFNRQFVGEELIYKYKTNNEPAHKIDSKSNQYSKFKLKN